MLWLKSTEQSALPGCPTVVTGGVRCTERTWTRVADVIGTFGVGL